MILRGYVIKPFVYCCKKRIPILRHYNELTDGQKMVYIGQVTSLFHSLFSIVTTFFGFFYADGERDTTWFHCNFYKLNMFDSQKFIVTAHAGYYIFDLLLVAHNKKNDPNHRDMIIHRILAILQCGLAVRV